MQNWSHVMTIMNVMNAKPAQARDETDFSRVREFNLNGWSKFYRQTLLFRYVCWALEVVKLAWRIL